MSQRELHYDKADSKLNDPESNRTISRASSIMLWRLLSAYFSITSHSSSPDYRNFNVVKENSANTNAKIQNRAITFDSDHPINSK